MIHTLVAVIYGLDPTIGDPEFNEWEVHLTEVSGDGEAIKALEGKRVVITVEEVE